ncbi:MAG: hypothetical protein LBM66_02190 [Bifidobacteriaceae bacterium]|nr:hypothetical protein [Bifidobacteriaceae bacterium]
MRSKRFASAAIMAAAALALTTAGCVIGQTTAGPAQAAAKKAAVTLQVSGTNVTQFRGETRIGVVVDVTTKTKTGAKPVGGKVTVTDGARTLKRVHLAADGRGYFLMPTLKKLGKHTLKFSLKPASGGVKPITKRFYIVVKKATKAAAKRYESSYCKAVRTAYDREAKYTLFTGQGNVAAATYVGLANAYAKIAAKVSSRYRGATATAAAANWSAYTNYLRYEAGQLTGAQLLALNPGFDFSNQLTNYKKAQIATCGYKAA